jgi:hypothetical protein
MNEPEQRDCANGTRKVSGSPSGWVRALVIAGAVAAVVVMAFAAQLALIASRLNAATLDPAFCSPGSLHTTVELPETQLTRDFVAIRILLKDPADNFATVRMLYEGKLQAPDLRRTDAWLSKRVSRGRLQTLAAPASTLKSEAVRIDTQHHSALEARIADGLARRDGAAVETAFRAMFAVLLDELLMSIGRQFDDPVTASRSFPHARRYYTEALEAHLTLKSPGAAAMAGNSLAAMSRAVDEAVREREAARIWFDRERQSFMRTIMTAIDDQRRG